MITFHPPLQEESRFGDMLTGLSLHYVFEDDRRSFRQVVSTFVAARRCINSRPQTQLSGYLRVLSRDVTAMVSSIRHTPKKRRDVHILLGVNF